MPELDGMHFRACAANGDSFRHRHQIKNVGHYGA
jgi:hypothetical protein